MQHLSKFGSLEMGFQLKKQMNAFDPGPIRCKDMTLKRLEYYNVIEIEYVCKI